MMRRFPRLWTMLLALVVAAGLARLGVWQMGRAAEKEALQAAIRAAEVGPELTEIDLIKSPRSPEWVHRRVNLTGRWLPKATIYLDNRPMTGRAGFIVVTPLVLEAGGLSVAVQRGWVPRDAQDRSRLPPIQTPEGLVSIEGRLAASPGALLKLGDVGPETGLIRQNLDLTAYASELGAPMLPLTVLQQGHSGEGLLRDWPEPTVNVHKHYGYAFQWFSLSALVLGLYVWFQLIRPRRAPN